MLEYLVVRLPAEPGEASWVVLDTAGQRLSPVTHGTLEAAAQSARNRRVLVLVPGLDAICTQASLPVKSASRLRQMLPYSLEDVFAEDVDRLHFAAGSRHASGEVPVTVVARRRMQHWLENCGAAGLVPERIYCESDGVPAVPGSLTLLVEGSCSYGRAPGQAPFAMQGMTASEILQVVSDSEGDPSERPHVVLYADEEGYAKCESDVAWLREQGLSLDVQLLREGLLPKLGATLVDRPGSNLVQGAYGQSAGWETWLQPWRSAAALLLGVLVLAIAGEGARYLGLDREHRALSARLEAACVRNVQSAVLATCEAEVRRRLAPVDEIGGTAFLTVLDAVTQAWNQDTRLETLSYRGGTMDLRIVAANVSVLDELARNVSSGNSLQASIQSANPTTDGILGRLQIGGGPQ